MTQIVELPRINVAREHYRILKEEFPDVSNTWIINCLGFKSKSTTAKAIRARAIQLLKEELDKAKNYPE